MMRNDWACGGLLAATMAALTACPGGNPTPTDETVKLGAVLSTTGDLAGIGEAQAQAIALAVSQINDGGGVLGGKKLELVSADDGTDTAKARTAAQTLVDKKVTAVVGAVGSGLSLAAADVLSKAKIVQISASSTSPLLTTFADDGYLFRACPSDAAQGKLLAQRAKAKGFTKVAVLSIPGAYGDGLAGTFDETFVAGGGTVTYKQSYIESAANYDTQLNDLFATSPQAVLLVAYPVDGGSIIKGYTLAHAGAGAFWYFTDAIASPEFVTGAGGGSAFSFSHEGSLPSSPSGAQWDAFAKAFKAKTGADANAGYYVGQAYDAVYLLALALEKAGKADGAAVRDALASLTSSSGTAYGADKFKDAADAAKAGTKIVFQGAAGPLVLDEKGDPLGALYDLWQVKDGVVTATEKGVAPAP